jgi:cytochrome b561
MRNKALNQFLILKNKIIVMPEEEASHAGEIILWVAFLAITILIMILISAHSNPISYFFNVVIPKILLGL